MLFWMRSRLWDSTFTDAQGRRASLLGSSDLHRLGEACFTVKDGSQDEYAEAGEEGCGARPVGAEGRESVS